MKLRTIILIIVVAVIVLSVTGVISLHAMFDSMFGKVDTGEDTTLERTVNADEFSNLVIEWAAGSIKIITADTDKITIQETKKSGNTHAMVTEYDGDTMTIRYASGISANMANLSAKHLTITVPQNWNCEELEINGAALDVNVSGLTAGSVELSGAATKLNYTGSFDELESDGAAAQLKPSQYQRRCLQTGSDHSGRYRFCRKNRGHGCRLQLQQHLQLQRQHLHLW